MWSFPHADMREGRVHAGLPVDNYRIDAHKTLTLLHTDSGWRIVREDSQPL